MTEVELYGQYGNIGLEDVKQTDLVTPRLQIDSKKNCFVNSLTKREFAAVKVIFLAQVKQRIMWPPDVDDTPSAAPQCKSTDFEVGFPNVDPKASQDKLFPWNHPLNVFDRDAGVQGAYLPQVQEETGMPALPCDKCEFKEWHNKKTMCKEQHAYALLIVAEDGTTMPAVLTLQGSGIAPSKAYVSPFAAGNRPLFTAYTVLTLDQRSRGTNFYSVPVFQEAEPTERAMWDEYAGHVHTMRAFLRRPPTRKADEDTQQPSVQAVAASNVNPVRVPPPAAAQPVAQAQVVEQGEDPWAAPAQVQPPVVAQPVPEAVAQPVAPPVTQVAPPVAPPTVQVVAPPVAVPPPVSQVPVAAAPIPVASVPTPATQAAAPVAAPVATVEDPDDLPF